MDDQGDPTATYAARRAQLEQAFTSLPKAGSAEYWAALSAPNTAGDELALETLARCWRAWNDAIRIPEANRVFDLIQRRIGQRIERWAHKIARQAPGGVASALTDDLQQECFTAVWLDLRSSSDFLLEYFLGALTRIEQHTAHLVMEREGYWTRKGVKQPKRAPWRQVESLDAAPATYAGADGEQRATEANLADPSAEAAFRRVEALADLGALLAALTPEQRDLFAKVYYEGLPQREIADDLGVTDRTVRNRLRELERALRALLADPDDSALSGPDAARKDGHDD